MDNPTQRSVVTIGAGISGLACARVLTEAGISTIVLDRDKSPGGRMASPSLRDRPVDLGASYLTARGSDFTQKVRYWQERGILRPWTDSFQVYDGASPVADEHGPMRYAAPGGLAVPLSDLVDGLEVRRGEAVRRVEAGARGPMVDGREVDAVVLAMPDPSALAVLDETLGEERTAAAAVRWEAVIAVAVEYPERAWAMRDGAFVNGHPVLSFVADDGARRGDGAPVLVAHSTTDFAREDPPDASARMLAAVREVLGVSAEPVWSQVRRWEHARPGAGRGGEPFFHLGDAMVGLCGDSWGSPRVETAYASGLALGRALASRLAAS